MGFTLIQRYLDSMETCFLNGKDEGQHTLEYLGEIDIKVAKSSFVLLCEIYPILRAKIRRDGHGFLLYLPARHLPSFETLSGDLETLRANSALVARSVIDCEDTSRMTIIKGRGKGYVILGISHCVTGQGTGPYFLRKFWNIYADILDGRLVSDESARGLPLSPSAVLKERWPCVKPELESLYTSSDQVSNYPEFNTEDKVFECEIRLSRDESDNVVKTSRSYGLTVNSLLIGETIEALSLKDPPRTGKIRISGPVRLHHRISPPVDVTQVTGLPAAFLMTLSANLGKLENAIHYKEKLNKLIQDKDVLIPFYNCQPKDIPRRDIIWNGFGQMPVFNDIHDLKVVDIFVLSSRMRESRFDLSRAQNSRSKIEVLSYSHNGAIQLNVRYTGSNARVLDKLRDQINVLSAN